MTRSFLTAPDVRVVPSLLAADFSRLERQIGIVQEAGASVLHLDVMDGHFVPNISFGVPVIASLRKRTQMYFDAHLMISEPLRYAEAFAKAGCENITFHVETVSDPSAALAQIRKLGVSVGVALNPTTPARAIEAIVEHVDVILVMSVWPGFGGQTFMADVLPKVAELRSRLAPHQRLEIDGGIDSGTIAAAARAGADLLVAGTAVFGSKDPAAAQRELQRLANDACKENATIR